MRNNLKICCQKLLFLFCFVLYYVGFSVCVSSIRIPLFIHSYHSFHSFFQFVRIQPPSVLNSQITEFLSFFDLNAKYHECARSLTRTLINRLYACVWLKGNNLLWMREMRSSHIHKECNEWWFYLLYLFLKTMQTSTPSIEHDGTKISKNNNDNVCIVSLYTDRIEMIDIDGILRQFDTARTTSNSSQWILFMDKNSNE